MKIFLNEITRLHAKLDLIGCDFVDSCLNKYDIEQLINDLEELLNNYNKGEFNFTIGGLDEISNEA